jgi:DNA polymerase-3 subunit delta'
MTKEAGNCLLKTLEEPPEFACIILISSNENMILNTIRSRCMKVKFRKIDDKSLYEYAIKYLGYTDISDNLLKTFDGSIGKAIKLKENKEKYSDIDALISIMKKDDIISVFSKAKFIYDKENIFDILDYLTVCLYSNSKKDQRYLNCIEYVSKTISNLRANGNFDMNIDSLLFNIWEELNEKSSRN